jgi:hypothetical protein
VDSNFKSTKHFIYDLDRKWVSCKSIVTCFTVLPCSCADSEGRGHVPEVQFVRFPKNLTSAVLWFTHFHCVTLWWRSRVLLNPLFSVVASVRFLLLDSSSWSPISLFDTCSSGWSLCLRHSRFPTGTLAVCKLKIRAQRLLEKVPHGHVVRLPSVAFFCCCFRFLPCLLTPLPSSCCCYSLQTNVMMIPWVYIRLLIRQGQGAYRSVCWSSHGMLILEDAQRRLVFPSTTVQGQLAEETSTTVQGRRQLHNNNSNKNNNNNNNWWRRRVTTTTTTKCSSLPPTPPLSDGSDPVFSIPRLHTVSTPS